MFGIKMLSSFSKSKTFNFVNLKRPIRILQCSEYWVMLFSPKVTKQKWKPAFEIWFHIKSDFFFWKLSSRVFQCFSTADIVVVQHWVNLQRLLAQLPQNSAATRSKSLHNILALASKHREKDHLWQYGWSSTKVLQMAN